MRKLIWLFIFLFPPLVSFAGMGGPMGLQVITGSTVASSPPAECTTSNHDSLADYHTSNSDDSGTNTDSAVWACQKFTLAAASTITQYLVRGYTVSGTTESAVCQIYNDDTGTYPDETSPVADTSVSVVLSTIGGSEEDVLFTLGTPKSISSGTYWLVCSTTSSDQFRVIRDTSVTGAASARANSGGSTYTEYSEQAYRIIVKGCVN